MTKTRNSVFVDTSGWAELLDKSLAKHDEVSTFVNQFVAAGGGLVTTNWVLVEMTALFHRPLRIPKISQIKMMSDLKRDPVIRIVNVDSDTESTAWKLWTDRPDKAWSLVDCSSFVVMNHLGVTEALTSDRHFEQAGFVRLLR